MKIKNFKGIKELEVNNLPVDSQWIFVTGDNWSGKTTFLQGISAGLVGKTDSNIRNLRQENAQFEVEYTNDQRSEINDTNDPNFSPFDNIIAYGASRKPSKGEMLEEDQTRVSPTASLFREDAVLNNVEKILILWEKEDKKKYIMLKKLFIDIFPELKDIKIQKTSEWSVIQYNIPSLSKDLITSEYITWWLNSIMTMIGDIIVKLLKNQNVENNLSGLSWIVIIDEFDAHLHPKFQKKFIEILTKNFPNIQFVVSTYSPITILWAPKKSTILKADKTVKEWITVEKLDIDVKNLLPNSLLTSPIFDFESITSNQFDKNSDDLSTEDYFSEIEFDKQIEERLKQFVKRNR